MFEEYKETLLIVLNSVMKFKFNSMIFFLFTNFDIFSSFFWTSVSVINFILVKLIPPSPAEIIFLQNVDNSWTSLQSLNSLILSSVFIIFSCLLCNFLFFRKKYTSRVSSSFLKFSVNNFFSSSNSILLKNMYTGSIFYVILHFLWALTF